MKTKWFYSLLFVIFFSVSVLPLLTSTCKAEVSAGEDVPKNPDYVFAVCQDVVDGNIIEVDILGMKRKLRLIGVNVGGIIDGIKGIFNIGPVGYLKKTVKGKKLYLEFEDDWTDSSGILRAYVHLKEGDTFINLEMIKKGYASVDRKSKYKYKGEFEKMGR